MTVYTVNVVFIAPKKKHLQVQLALKLKRFQSFRSQVALILGWRLVIRALSS